MCEQLAVLEKKVDTLISHFQKPESRFRRDDRARERNFTKAVCSECGKDCEIPFKPTGDRPVYCRDCFSARNDSKSFKVKFGDRPREESSSRPRKFDNRAEPRGQGLGRKKGSFFQRRKR
ncbi:MAG: hypothetical protein JXL82_00190 [Candidatus Omnitrophica bacterium]|nr:hypothetical protein [Candidatus Omnitrophota bacterium]